MSARSVDMVTDVLVREGRRIRFAVSDNIHAHGPAGPGSPPIWAVNIHGYFAGGGMYWRESAHLAETLGWRVVNPSLPGFAGSDPMPWEHVNIREIAEQVVHVLDHVGAGPVVLLGHSMGGAVAIQFADSFPERTLGIIYRDGAATPAWKHRHGLVVSLLAPFAPDIAGVADLLAAVVFDSGDLLVGRRLASTLRGLWPDARRNIRAMGRTLPVGSMLMALDLRREVMAAVDRGIPILPVWGCFDEIANPATAKEFSVLADEEILWVPGGHSWMLPRPQGQGDVLRYLDRGKAFVERMAERQQEFLDAGIGAAAPAAPPGRMRVVR